MSSPEVSLDVSGRFSSQEMTFIKAFTAFLTEQQNRGNVPFGRIALYQRRSTQTNKKGDALNEPAAFAQTLCWDGTKFVLHDGPCPEFED